MFVDNFTEYKRSVEVPQYIAHVYETNMLVSIEEYVTPMDLQEFKMNESGIKQVLSELSKVYVFEDIGFDTKNFMNWGYRDNGDIVILDAGYIYPIKGNEKALSCPKCKSLITYNGNYTGFICSNKNCKSKYNFLNIRRRMNLTLENAEDRMLFELQHQEAPDFNRLNLN